MMSSPEVTVYKILSQLVRELTHNSGETKKKAGNKAIGKDCTEEVFL